MPPPSVAAEEQPEVPAPGPADEQIERIALDRIKVSDRLRPISEAHVQWMVADMWRNGQLQPVEVCHDGKDYRLGPGGHRYEAAKRLGWTEINAIVRGHEKQGRRRREISENLIRHELNPLDRAAHVAELYQLMLVERGGSIERARKMGALALNERIKAEAKDAEEMISGAFDLQDQIAEKIGLTSRTIRNDIALFRGLEPDLVARLRDTPMAAKTTQLLALAKLSPKDRKAITAMVVSGAAKTVSEGQSILGGGRAERPAEKLLKVALNAFEKLGMPERAQFLAEIAKRKLPKGHAISAPATKEKHS